MNNYFWLVVLPNLDCFFGTLGILGLLACIIGGFVYMHKKIDVYGGFDEKEAWEFAKKMFKLFAVSMTIFFVTCFIPTKKDIIQLKAISMISELKDADKMPQKLIDRLNDLLDPPKA